MMTRTGRRRGAEPTRATILAAAREAFAVRGFARTTIRQVAAAADVDQALVLHYFTTKEQLFLAVLHSAVDPQRLLSQLFAGDAGQLGEQIVCRFLALWEDGAGLTASALLRTAVTEERTAQLVREVILPAVVAELVLRVGMDPAEAPMRATLIASQLSGLVTTRCVLKLEPMASAPADWVAAVVGPTVTRYLTGELPRSPDLADHRRMRSTRSSGPMSRAQGNRSGRSQ
jgi:AcrR family transcriptional regulator